MTDNYTTLWIDVRGRSDWTLIQDTCSVPSLGIELILSMNGVEKNLLLKLVSKGYSLLWDFTYNAKKKVNAIQEN